MNIDEDTPCRIVFNEITEQAVKNAIKNPRTINRNLVDAQQARRILDRVVGYKISPLLWRKVRKGLSAGRVQSVATRMICDREKEIQDFKPEEYWTLKGDFLPLSPENHDTTRKNAKNSQSGKEVQVFEASLYGLKDKKLEPRSKEDMDRILLIWKSFVPCGKDTKARGNGRHLRPLPPVPCNRKHPENWDQH